jgi:peptide/nickel transport system substrate-binding protein
MPALPYAPARLAPPDRPLKLSLLIADPTQERVGIALQRQLRSVGVATSLEMPGTAAALTRVAAGDFDLILTDAISAPTLLRPYLFWHSKGPYNYGGYASADVDAALDSIRHAVDDEAYKSGVAAFQRAILDDPPAIFLAWSERARAVSTAFDVPAEPGRDPLSTLRLWRPVATSVLAANH